jgi:SnoaL-like domain
MDAMDKAELLWEMEQVRQVGVRYFRLLDAKRWEEFGDLFTVDSVVRIAASDQAASVRGAAAADHVVKGRDDIVATYSQSLQGAVTVHHGHLPEVVVTGPTTATAVWQMQDHVEAGPGSPLESIDIGYGYHSGRYEMSGDGRWRIAELLITRSIDDL